MTIDERLARVEKELEALAKAAQESFGSLEYGSETTNFNDRWWYERDKLGLKGPVTFASERSP